MGVDADCCAAFGLDGEVAGLPPFERLDNAANAWGGNGRFQNYLTQSE